MKKLRITLVCLILTLLLTACGENKAPEVKHNADPLWETELEGADPKFVGDYIYLWDLLENEYPMLAAAQRITGKDAQEVKERYYKRIPSCTLPEDFYRYVVTPCLNEFDGTGHLSVVPHDFYEMVYTNYKGDYDYTLSVPRSVYNFSQLTTEEALNFYQSAVERAEAKIGASSEKGTAPYISFNNADNLRFDRYPEQSAGYVAIRRMNTFFSEETFTNTEHKALMAFFSELEDAGYEHCIIDVRGNPGGSSNYWYHSLVVPNLSETLGYESLSLIRGEFCKYYMETLFGDWPVSPIAELNTERLPKLRPEDTRDAIAYTLQYGEVAPTEAGKPVFSGKFWLLVDERVYSASEAFSIFCKQTGFATLVGTNTGGDGIGIDPILFALPQTGICIRFSASNGLNPDGSCNEEVGTAPDYYINGKEDALKKCLTLIANQS